MNSHFCLLLFLVVFIGKINTLPRYRFRRQINSLYDDEASLKIRSARQNDISGSIVGATYYGAGADPNYGSFIPRPNSPNSGGIVPISYNADSYLSNYLVNPNQQQQNYMYGSNNVWPSPNGNNYNSQLGNRYPPGSQGWYATGGNYWYNNGQSIIAHPYHLMISVVLLIFCK